MSAPPAPSHSASLTWTKDSAGQCLDELVRLASAHTDDAKATDGTFHLGLSLDPPSAAPNASRRLAAIASGTTSSAAVAQYSQPAGPSISVTTSTSVTTSFWIPAPASGAPALQIATNVVRGSSQPVAPQQGSQASEMATAAAAAAAPAAAASAASLAARATAPKSPTTTSAAAPPKP